MHERRNINRGYRKLDVWQNSVTLYVFVCKALKEFPFELKKPAANAIDASMSIQRNIAKVIAESQLKNILTF